MRKKQIVRALRITMPIVAMVCAVVFVPWVLLRAWLAPLPDSIQQEVNQAIACGFDGIIVYVDEAGEPSEFYAAGWKNRENQIPADPHSLFKIASISKLYIAVATAKMVNEKRLSLDRVLADYLPEFAGRFENAHKISLRMLLQHRSGIPNYTDHPDYPWDHPFKNSHQTYQLVLDRPADFAPNKKYRYSNTNYLLIGEILDRTLGYSHHEYIKKKVLQPLGLNNTYSLLSEVNPVDVMSGYSVGYGADIKLNDFIQPGGSMVATAQDVGIFLRALNNGTLLNDNEQAIYSSIYQFEHTGLLPGYQSIARYHKDIDTIIIQFVNTSGGNMWPLSEIIYNRIVKILRSKRSDSNL